MDVVFEGSLTKSWGIKDVLKTVMEEKDLPWSVLRISNSEKRIQGKILVANSNYIVGAFCTGSASDTDSYESLRTVLTLSEGVFALLALSESESKNFDHSLYISIDRILDTLGSLPSDSAELFDEKGLLDKVFGDDAEELSFEPTKERYACMKNQVDSQAFRRFRKSIEKKTVLPIADNSTAPPVPGSMVELSPLAMWDTMEPLFDNGSTTSSSSPMIPGFVQADDQRASLGRLRTLPQKSSIFNLKKIWHELRAFQWLPLILLLIGIASFVAPQVWPTGGIESRSSDKLQEAARPGTTIN